MLGSGMRQNWFSEGRKGTSFLGKGMMAKFELVPGLQKRPPILGRHVKPSECITSEVILRNSVWYIRCFGSLFISDRLVLYWQPCWCSEWLQKSFEFLCMERKSWFLCRKMQMVDGENVEADGRAFPRTWAPPTLLIFILSNKILAQYFSHFYLDFHSIEKRYIS